MGLGYLSHYWRNYHLLGVIMNCIGCGKEINKEDGSLWETKVESLDKFGNFLQTCEECIPKTVDDLKKLISKGKNDAN